MVDQKKFIVSHAPYWHCGKSITQRSYGIIIAALPAVLAGIYYFGMPALGVISLSVSFAILWELAFNHVAKRPNTIGDGNAALIGLLFGMMLPATAPFWLVITGTLVAVVVGKQIYGGIGSNPFGLDLRVSKGSATDEGDFVASMELSIPLDKVVLMPNESFHEGRIRLYVGAADEEGDLSELQEATVPIRIPSEEVGQAGEAFFVYRSPVRLDSGRHRIAVGVWDEIGHASSFVTRSVEVGGS